MHGRVNMWPKHMLCGYLRNRRNRESTILKAIENGAKTLFDVVAYTYRDVNPSFWMHASSNVRLHVDHLAQQDKLPKDFSLDKFGKTCGLHFLLRWVPVYLSSALSIKPRMPRKRFVYGAAVAVAAASLAMFLSMREQHNHG
nr:Lactamase_B domain-containing protein [Ipomoea batatas]